ncbi:hypothetical protein [Microbacterium sp. No. 7]|uniref:hypothetical protein n=1 Tax=Microbacterium sp. No. 7 TaxID=1714373 RepID=UPI0006CFE0C4|nr:hypothetical protein [Microbacterium sp. No. 7]ALJ20713.1 hypothetical protein AOA12_12710 [Microbacterium sp. No. 7]
MNSVPLQRLIEGASSAYAASNGIQRTDEWLVLKLNEEVGEFTQAFLALSGQARDKGDTATERTARFRAELADVYGQVLLLAERFDVDLTAEVRRKWRLPAL